ncbi:helix-turn-helix transcriptional regulator [Enterobacteriaceae bacterium C23F]
MITIIMQGDDGFYLNGMEKLVADIFKVLCNKEVTILRDLSEENIRQADMIILNLLQGEEGTCVPELRFRQKGVVIGMVENVPRGPGRYPSCYQDIVYLSRSATLADIRSRITSIWQEYELGRKPIIVNCPGCCHKVMSRQQARIMAGLYLGKTPAEIARDLSISDKTVFSHKYMTMNRFNLSSSGELFLFLQNLAAKNITPNYFRECLEQETASQGLLL